VVLVTIAQVLWFWPKAIHQIDYDGISYTRIATELKLGEFRQSVNAFRSPLISWSIAAVPYSSALQAGKLISVLSFVSTLLLLYLLTKELWGSRGAALLAVLLFSIARGISFLCVAFVTPDFLLATLALGYFVTLLRYVRKEPATWWTLGLWHGMAFLAKAIALPWLGVCTCATALCLQGNRRVRLARALSGLFIPAVVALLWGSVLHSKYGVFTTGSQFQVNLMQWTLKDIIPKRPSPYAVLTDIQATTDEHMVDDPMPPGSRGWHYRASSAILVARILNAEMRNVPKAAKELTILLTPGGVLAFGTVLLVLRRSAENGSERIFAVVVLVGSVALVLAYSMLVIDARYLIPIVPLWLAIGSGVLELQRGRWLKTAQWISLVLLLLGFMWSMVYRSSPWRIQTRDWQSACYRAGEALQEGHIKTVVSIGSGPYPDHGVGWEAGYKASYFGGARLVATSFSLSQPEELATDVTRADSDAVLVWSTNKQERSTVELALGERGYTSQESIVDPYVGGVGSVLFRVRAGESGQPR
jgi:hypothetical protein